MTRKDYELIAKTIRAVSTFAATDKSKRATKVIDILVQSLSIALKGDNDRFDEARFVAACKYNLAKEGSDD